ncbi:MAG TPA: Clp protease N-terminal domain-containing protein [Solirubrobacteraceae bacterium]
MFERFTDEARQVVVGAQEEAREIGHDYIGTEHILLGLLRSRPSAASEALSALGIGLDDARARIIQIVSRSEQPSEGQIPFTPRAKKVLELSLREALSRGQNYIGSEHILLGLIREGEGVAARVLLDYGVTGEALRQATLDRMPVPGPQPPEVAPVATSGVRSDRPIRDAWTDGLAGHLGTLSSEIRAEFGRGADAGDLLLALACAPGTLVERVLRELGVDLDELWGRIETVRRERLVERAAVECEIAEVRQAKDAAVESHEFARAAELRDSERVLRERLRESAAVHPDALVLIRRRLGIPEP